MNPERFALRAGNNRSPGQRSHRRLMMEPLEERSLLAAVAAEIERTAAPAFPLAALYSSVSAGSSRGSISAAALADDFYEENDFRLAARNLGTITSPRTINQLALADAADWYRFSTTRSGTLTDHVAINFLHTQGNLNLELYNASGQRLRSSLSSTNTERISLNGLAAGTYYVRVMGNLRAVNPNYSLTLNIGQVLADDAFEQNDTAGAARDLGTQAAAQTFSNLVMADGLDWYRFTMDGAGSSSDFVSINFVHAQGNLTLRVYTLTGQMVGNSATLANSERVSLAGLAAGSYFVQVVGVNGAINPNYSLTIDPGTAIVPPSPPSASGGGFDIQFTFSGLTASQRAIFEQAAQKWESVIVGELPNAVYGGVAVDDLLIDARAVPIDGRGNVLGQAGPDRFRTVSRLPYHGSMEFDSADLASMQASGTLLGVILHEMGHVLGVGTLWSMKGLIFGEGGPNPIFIGSQAVAAYNSIFGISASSVPVENTGGFGTRDGHWRESIFSTELMTGWVGPGSYTPLSRITVGSLADLGYSVNYAAADPYARPGSLLRSTATAASFNAATASALQLIEPRLASDASMQLWQRLAAVSKSDTMTPRLSRSEAMLRPAKAELMLPGHKTTAAAVDALLADWFSLKDELSSNELLT
jgi:hypothetical protein